jgi:CheY-like chemotaxis protein
MLRTLIGENIELEMSLGEGLGLLQVDPTMIQQVVMNLCINARDAMLSGGRLLIKTENITIAQGDDASAVHGRPGRYVRLTVSDTGSGIPAEVLERIFEPFFTTKDIGKGTGLGLSMVYGVVKQHGGMIRVRSAAGQGATFEIDLPTADVASQAAEPTSLHSAFGGTETILVAEDDPLVRAAVVRVLTEAGYAVLSASDGEEAVRVFAEHSTAIALVLLDMIMPIMGGREAHRQIAEINPDTPVVYCTGYDSGLESLDAAEVARLWVLTKPVAPETLLNTLREVLDKGSPCLTS